MNRQDLEHLKQSLTIERVAARFFPAWRPAKSCRCPWRGDKSPSFSVYDSGRKWKDFAAGAGGDSVDFIARAAGVSLSEAWRIAAEIVGSTVFQKPEGKEAASFRWPARIPATKELIEATSESRGISPVAVKAAGVLGTFCFGNVCGEACWILRDGSCRGYEARRVDGKPFEAYKSLPERKCHCKGNLKSWPLGLDSLTCRKPDAYVICEGGPDYLACLGIVAEHGPRLILPVTMLGKSNNICAEALPRFKGKPTLIISHGDAADRARVWRRQLQPHVVIVKVVVLGDADLNDLVRSGDAGEISTLIRSL